jgi:hypothetical protein
MRRTGQYDFVAEVNVGALSLVYISGSFGEVVCFDLSSHVGVEMYLLGCSHGSSLVRGNTGRLR